MKDIDTLEARFKAELVAALQRAANGRSPLLFSLKDDRSRSSARKLRTKAQRIMELRQSYSVDHSERSPAASYLATCLRWEHGSSDKHLAQRLAKALLHELRNLAT